PGEARAALDRVSLTVETGRFVAVTGPNRAGKSSLSRVLAGAALESGTIERPGAVALGRPHGTAMLFQRPESQVLGVRVRDDVVWGLRYDDATAVDVDALLAQVGLAGLADRETSTLSGGELQRLALASALARAPALLVSDESTAMVDTAGRRRLLDLLRGLTSRGTTVVHVTHRYGEIDRGAAAVTRGDDRGAGRGSRRAGPGGARRRVRVLAGHALGAPCAATRHDDRARGRDRPRARRERLREVDARVAARGVAPPDRGRGPPRWRRGDPPRGCGRARVPARAAAAPPADRARRARRRRARRGLARAGAGRGRAGRLDRGPADRRALGWAAASRPPRPTARDRDPCARPRRAVRRSRRRRAG